MLYAHTHRSRREAGLETVGRGSGGKISHLGGVPDLSSKLAPRPLPDPPVFDSPIGFQVIDSFGRRPFARLADA